MHISNQPTEKTNKKEKPSAKNITSQTTRSLLWAISSLSHVKVPYSLRAKVKVTVDENTGQVTLSRRTHEDRKLEEELFN